MTNSLFMLYELILIPILSEWIVVDDLCSLDTAICNHKFRHQYLQVLSKCFVTDSDVYRTGKDKYSWVALRNIHLGSLVVSQAVVWEPIVTLLQQDCHLRFLRINCYNNLDFFRMVDYIRVEQFTLSTVRYSDVETIMSSLRGVTSLDVSDFLRLRKSYFNKFPLWFPGLRIIQASCFGQYQAVMKHCHITEYRHLNLRHISTPWSLEKMDYYCDLLLTNNADPSSTLMIDNNQYSITALELKKKLSVYDRRDMVPYLCHLKSLTLKYYNILPRNSSWSCSHLLVFHARKVWFTQSELVTIFMGSSKLKHIHLMDCRSVNSMVLQAIADHCPQLAKLHLKRYTASPDSFGLLVDRCPNLASLDVDQSLYLSDVLTHSPVSVASLKMVTYSRSLVSAIHWSPSGHGKCVDWFCGLKAESVHMHQICLEYTNIRLIDFHNQNFNDTMVAELVDHSPHLTSVSLTQCNVTGACLVSLTNCGKLTALTISTAHGVTDELIELFLCGKKTFRELSLPQCRGFTGKSVVGSIVKHCPDMEVVQLTDNHEVRNDDVITLLEGCCKLHTLSLEFCKEITAKVMPYVEKRKMRHLNLLHTSIKGSFKKLKF